MQQQGAQVHDVHAVLMGPSASCIGFEKSLIDVGVPPEEIQSHLFAVARELIYNWFTKLLGFITIPSLAQPDSKFVVHLRVTSYK